MIPKVQTIEVLVAIFFGATFLSLLEHFGHTVPLPLLGRALAGAASYALWIGHHG